MGGSCLDAEPEEGGLVPGCWSDCRWYARRGLGQGEARWEWSRTMTSGAQGFAEEARHVWSQSGEIGQDGGDHAWNGGASLGAGGKC